MPAKRQGQKKRSMSAAHKAALAQGRAQGRAVANYLDALERNRPKRGRKRTTESVKRQLGQTREALKTADGARRLELIQRRRDLENELESKQSGGDDIAALERGFVKVARGYASRKGISYGSFREFGVPADVLKRAGIGRGG
jgi:hypothetical protein